MQTKSSFIKETADSPTTIQWKSRNSFGRVVIIEWLKRHMQGVVIYSSYDGVNWVEIGRDFKSPFEDVRKNKVVHTPETRYYKLRYLLNDKPVGIESTISTAIVMID